LLNLCEEPLLRTGEGLVLRIPERFFGTSLLPLQTLSLETFIKE